MRLTHSLLSPSRSRTRKFYLRNQAVNAHICLQNTQFSIIRLIPHPVDDEFKHIISAVVAPKVLVHNEGDDSLMASLGW